MSEPDLRGCKVMLVDDERTILIALRDSLRDVGAEVVTAASGDEALAILEVRSFDVVISDVRMPGLSGIDLLARIRQGDADTPVILMTAYANVEHAVAAMRSGAYDYVTKPFPNEKVIRIVTHAWSLAQLRTEVKQLRSRVGAETDLGFLVGKSPAWRRVVDKIETVAVSDSTVLIVGKSGTGKELVARALHLRSKRRDEPYIKVHCAALPMTLMESELFGHIKGAFTGANQDSKGRFELADGGTLLLDEVDEIPAEVQVKLLRVIQERTIERVGSGRSIPVDVRLLATSKGRLEELVEAGTFRQDLLYRLSVVQLQLPELKERREDIPLLINHFLGQCRERMGKGPDGLTHEALEALMTHDYPGNVRELEHLIESACAQSPGQEIDVDALPDALPGGDRPRVGFSARPLADVMVELERSYLEHALHEFEGSRVDLARELGISRKSLWQKLKKHGLD